MKNVYRVSTEQHGDMKSGILRSKNATILQAWCATALVHCLAQTCESPETHKCDRFARFLWL